MVTQPWLYCAQFSYYQETETKNKKINMKDWKRKVNCIHQMEKIKKACESYNKHKKSLTLERERERESRLGKFWNYKTRVMHALCICNRRKNQNQDKIVHWKGNLSLEGPVINSNMTHKQYREAVIHRIWATELNAKEKNRSFCHLHDKPTKFSNAFPQFNHLQDYFKKNKQRRILAKQT